MQAIRDGIETVIAGIVREVGMPAMLRIMGKLGVAAANGHPRAPERLAELADEIENPGRAKLLRMRTQLARRGYNATLRSGGRQLDICAQGSHRVMGSVVVDALGTVTSRPPPLVWELIASIA